MSDQSIPEDLATIVVSGLLVIAAVLAGIGGGIDLVTGSNGNVIESADVEQEFIIGQQAVNDNLNSIDACGIIDSSGRYLLTDDINDSTTATCLNITADDVILEGNGHTIDGVDTIGSVGISVSRYPVGNANITVRNLTLTDWEDGIYAEYVFDSSFSDILSVSNERYGVNVWGSTGVLISNTTAASNGGAGILVERSGKLILRDNEIRQNGRDGIFLSAVTGTKSKHNTLTENDGAGYLIRSGSRDNRFIDDVATSNTGYGIRLFGAGTNNTFVRANASSNGINGFSLADVSNGGGTTGTTIVDAIATGNGQWAYHGENDAVGNAVSNITLSSARVSFTSRDIGIVGNRSIPDAPSGKTELGSGFLARNTSTDSWLNISMTYSEADIDGIDESTIGLYRRDGSNWSGVSGSSLDTSSNLVTANITQFGLFGLFAESLQAEGNGSGLMDRAGPTESYTTKITKTAEYEVSFKSGPVVPDAGLDTSLVEAHREMVWALVQFYDDDPEDHFDTLEGLGYQHIETLTPNTHYAGVPRTQLQTVIDLPSVRSVQVIEPEWKLSRSILNGIEAERIRDDTSTEIVVYAFEEPAFDGLELVGEGRYIGGATLAELRTIQDDMAVWWITEPAVEYQSVREGLKLISANYGNRDGTFVGKSLPFSGAGITVGVIDSGIDHDHFHFNSTTIIDSKDWVDDDYFPEGLDSHGTHVAGTIAGRKGSRQGVAPNATLVVSRIFDNSGNWSSNNPSYNYDHLYQEVYDSVGGVDIISNSWGHDGDGDYDWQADDTDEWASAHPDTLLVFAAGNYDDDFYVNSPALGVNTLAVNAFRDGSRWRVTRGEIDETDEVSELSNLNRPADFSKTRRKKPEVLAPGEWTVAPIPNSTERDKYDVKLGSSMATPHVAGVAALVQEAYPNYDANELRALIVGTTNPVRNPNGYLEGYGGVDAHNALFVNDYESEQVLFEPQQKGLSGIGEDEVHVYEVDVPPGAEEFVVSLSWLDPTRCLCDAGVLWNDLDLFVAPASEMPSNYADMKNLPAANRADHDSNVKKMVFENPGAGTWKIAVAGYEVGFFSNGKQNYDVITRVVTDPPTLSHSFSETSIDLGGGELEEVRLTIEAQGAPVSGIYVTVDDVPSNILVNRRAHLVGDLSKGQSVEIPIRFRYNDSQSFVRDLYGIDVAIQSTNGNTPITQTIAIETVEGTPPPAVTGLSSPTHDGWKSYDEWSPTPYMIFEWDEVSDDPGGSGMGWYHVLLSADDSPSRDAVYASTHDLVVADDSQDTAEYLIGDSRLELFGFSTGEWYFHVVPEDLNGNLGPVTSVGPYKIDIDPPADLEVKFASAFTPEYTEGFTNSTYVRIIWDRPDDVSSRQRPPDNGSGVAGYDYGIGGLTSTSADPDATRWNFHLDEGDFTFYLQAFDEVGHRSNVTTKSFTIDTTPPDADAGENVSTYTCLNEVTLNASASTDNEGIVEYVWHLDDASVLNPGGTTVVTTTPTLTQGFGLGYHEVELEVVDVAGNRANDTVIVEVYIAPVGSETLCEVGNLELKRWNTFEVKYEAYENRENIDRAILFSEVGLYPTEPLTDFELGLIAHSSTPDGVAPLEPVLASDDGTKFHTLQHSDGYEGQTQLSFFVGDTVLTDSDVAVSDVVLYRYADDAIGTDGTWEQLETAVVEEQADGTRFETQAFDGLSVFAVSSLEPPQVDVGDDQRTVIGTSMTLTASFEDPNPDETHTAYIDWGDGTTESLPIDTDGNVIADHSYDMVGFYSASVEICDTNDKCGSDSVSVIVRGAADEPYGTGFWKHEYSQRGNTSYSQAKLGAFLDIVNYESAVFSEDVSVDTIESAESVMAVRGRGLRNNAYAHLLAAWSNYAAGGVGWAERIDTDYDGIPDTPFHSVMGEVETILLDSAASESELERAKDLAEAVNSE